MLILSSDTKKIMNWTRVINYRCPQCGKGRMFPYSTYNIREFHKMDSRCSVCSKNFIPESGFYTGAMYFSYAINVGLIIGCGMLGYFLAGRENLMLIILSGSLPSIILAPLTFRISRSLMLHLFG